MSERVKLAKMEGPPIGNLFMSTPVTEGITIFEPSRQTKKGPPTVIPKPDNINYNAGQVPANVPTTSPFGSSAFFNGMAFDPSNPEMNSLGWMTNTYIPHKRRARKMEDFDFQQPKMLIITSKTPTTVEKRVGQYTMTTIPGFNFWQARAFDKMKGKTAEEVWNDWFFDGRVITEEGGIEPNYRQEQNKERLFNLAISGVFNTYNIWGSKIRHGTRLFLILKRVCYNSAVMYDLGGSGNSRAISGSSLTNEFRPFQLIPYACSHHQNPPESELEYIDCEGKKQRGVAVYIGMFDDSFRKNKICKSVTHGEKGVHNSTWYIMSLDDIRVIIDA